MRKYATSNRIGEGGFGRNGPVSPGMTRLRRAQSMIRHVLEGEAEPLAASWADGVEEVSETRVKGPRISTLMLPSQIRVKPSGSPWFCAARRGRTEREREREREREKF